MADKKTNETGIIPTEVLGIRVPIQIKEQIKNISSQERRPLSYQAQIFLEIGLAVYLDKKEKPKAV